MRNTTLHSVQADGRGRLLLPAEMREALNLTPKATVAVELGEDGSVILRDPVAYRNRLISEAMGSFEGVGMSVDELIAERRAEAAREP